MKQTGTWIASAIFILAMLAVAVWIYPALPTSTVTHWGANGQPNGWMPRFWAAAIWPLLMLGMAVLFALLPVISPRKFEIKPFASTYGIVTLAVLAFLLVVGTTALLSGAGRHVAVDVVAPVAVGALLVLIGNFMGKFRKNFFVGIRTPWTLASDAVWERTHRLGGWSFVLAGLVWIVGGLLHATSTVLIAAVLAAAFVPAVWSYFLYRRIEGRLGSGRGQP
ncbi:MAG: SdpI family protein [Rhodanobacteraceae bacterium]